MKLFYFLIVFLAVSYANCQQDVDVNANIRKNNYVSVSKLPLQKDNLRFGIIPYFLFSRSFGAYISIPIAQEINLEYRVSYTIPTNFEMYYFVETGDHFYYRGINNFFLYSLRPNNNFTFSFILGYRYWWDKSYFGKVIYINNSKYESYYSLDTKKGGVFGIEIAKRIDTYKMDCQFFTNAGITFFKVRNTLSGIEQNANNSDYKLLTLEKSEQVHFNLSLGFKFGFSIKKSH